MVTLPMVLWLALAAGQTREVPPPAAVEVSRSAGHRSAAEQSWSKGAPRTWQVSWENDVLAGRDEQYSNGMAFVVSRPGAGPLSLVWRAVGRAGRESSGYEAGQLFVTPADISRDVPDPADRPYVGMVYAALSTHVVAGNRSDNLKIVTGIAGPASGASRVQRAIHSFIGSPYPNGWAHQLRNEPILNGVYEQRRRYQVAGTPRTWAFQVIPSAGAMLGNVLTQAHVGVHLRVGRALRDDFGTSLIRGIGTLPAGVSAGRPVSSRTKGLAVFASGGSTVVVRNLSLDGNTFRDGPHVDKRPAFVTAEAGVAAWIGRLEVALSLVYWGREYDAQTRPARFGSIKVSVRPGRG